MTSLTTIIFGGNLHNFIGAARIDALHGLVLSAFIQEQLYTVSLCV